MISKICGIAAATAMGNKLPMFFITHVPIYDA